MIIGEEPPIDLLPHTLVVVPPGQAIRIVIPYDERSSFADATVDEHRRASAPQSRGSLIGDRDSHTRLICGYFKASYGSSMDLFATLRFPIVEQFDAADQLDHKLRAASAELIAQEVGMGAMATSLLKQVIVTLLRRSLTSVNLWVERLPLLGDRHVARAFADMAARPSAPHCVETLACTAGLSRSAFMAHFANSFGRSPMMVLRELRMRRAAILLANDNRSIDSVARQVGYANRSSFQRTFQKTYGIDPSDYRAAARRPPGRRPSASVQ